MLQEANESIRVVSISSGSWRGAMIEADQATDPAAEEKENKDKDKENPEADKAALLEAGQSSLLFTPWKCIQRCWWKSCLCLCYCLYFLSRQF